MLLLFCVAAAVVCAVSAAALWRPMRALADSDSRWLRSGVHVVLAGAGGFAAPFVALGWADLATFVVLIVACALLVPIDLAVYRLPDAIVLPLYPVMAVGLTATAAEFGEWGSLGRAAAGAAVLLVLYYVLALINPSGMGLGDVKLAGVLGAFLGWLGWPAVIVGTVAAFVLSAAVALVLLAARRVGPKSGIAFGPAMVFGAAVGAAFAVASAGPVTF